MFDWFHMRFRSFVSVRARCSNGLCGKYMPGDWRDWSNPPKDMCPLCGMGLRKARGWWHFRGVKWKPWTWSNWTFRAERSIRTFEKTDAARLTLPGKPGQWDG